MLDTVFGTTDTNGTLKLNYNENNAVNSHTLTVSSAYYVTEEIRFQGSISTGKWDNALLQRQDSSGSPLLTVRMGRLIPAPTGLVDETAILAMGRKPDDPHKIFLYRTPDRHGLAYRWQWLQAKPVELAEEVLLPREPPPQDATAWERFNTNPADPPADIETGGRFFWLLYPSALSNLQFAAAVWSPDIPDSQPLRKLDMIVFYSPHTAEYSETYPFGLSKGSSNQHYMDLAAKYLLERGFIYFLVARKLKAVLIMPICNKGDWGPFSTGEGVFRLCREVALFLHRECRTSALAQLNVDRTTYDGWYYGSSLRNPSASLKPQSADFGIPPSPGRVVTSCFSTGAKPFKTIMQTWPLSKFAQQYWGCPRASGLPDPHDAFNAAWQEIWDMDGFHPDTGGWPTYLDLLKTWMKANNNRSFRLCHSYGRVPPNPKTDKNPLWTTLMNESKPNVDLTLKSSPKFGGGREIHAQRWSAVAFDDAYVANTIAKPPGLPYLGPSGHDNTPVVAFSHNTKLSLIGK